MCLENGKRDRQKDRERERKERERDEEERDGQTERYMIRIKRQKRRE